MLSALRFVVESLGFRANGFYLSRFSIASQEAAVAKVRQVTHAEFERNKSLSFEAFKKTKVEPLEEFSNTDEIKLLFGNDSAKISQAYRDYCLSMYNRYVMTQYGGNPARML
jgi:hypothetical protein